MDMQDHWFHEHVQALPNKYPRIWIVFIWSLEGFIHNSTQILVGSLKRVMPEKMNDGCWRDHTSSL